MWLKAHQCECIANQTTMQTPTSTQQGQLCTAPNTGGLACFAAPLIFLRWQFITTTRNVQTVALGWKHSSEQSTAELTHRLRSLTCTAAVSLCMGQPTEATQCWSISD